MEARGFIGARVQVALNFYRRRKGPHHAACPGRLQAAPRLPAGRAVVAEPCGVQVHPSVEGAAWWSRPAVQTAASVARLGARPDSAEGSSSSSSSATRQPWTGGRWPYGRPHGYGGPSAAGLGWADPTQLRLMDRVPLTEGGRVGLKKRAMKEARYANGMKVQFSSLTNS